MLHEAVCRYGWSMAVLMALLGQGCSAEGVTRKSSRCKRCTYCEEAAPCSSSQPLMCLRFLLKVVAPVLTSPRIRYATVATPTADADGIRLRIRVRWGAATPQQAVQPYLK